jgi:hypothetical protein
MREEFWPEVLAVQQAVKHPLTLFQPGKVVGIP